MDYNNARETADSIVKQSNARLGEKSAVDTIILQLLLDTHVKTMELAMRFRMTPERYMEIHRVIMDSVQLAVSEGKRMREKEKE